jgi:hypothetical protein
MTECILETGSGTRSPSLIFATRPEVPPNTIPDTAPEPIAFFRFVPRAYLNNCGSVLDRGAESLLYLQALINEEN